MGNVIIQSPPQQGEAEGMMTPAREQVLGNRAADVDGRRPPVERRRPRSRLAQVPAGHDGHSVQRVWPRPCPPL
jgi:hypothetical protein